MTRPCRHMRIQPITLDRMPARWDIFDNFRAPTHRRSVTWNASREWASAIETQLGVERPLLERARAHWDALLADLGGDPSATDWTTFRMLRREREEDWSDWLAQL